MAITPQRHWKVFGLRVWNHSAEELTMKPTIMYYLCVGENFEANVKVLSFSIISRSLNITARAFAGFSA